MLSFFLLNVAPSQAQFGKLAKKLKGGGGDDAGSTLVTKSKVSIPGDPYGKCQDFITSYKIDPVRGAYYETYFDIGKGMKKGRSVFSLKSSKSLNAYVNEGDSAYLLVRSPMLKDPNGKQTQLKYHTRALRTADGVYLCYHADGTSETGKAGTPSFARGDIKVPLIIASTEALHDEWYGDKATNYVKDFEAKLEAAYKQAKSGVIADARMPKKGKLHKDELVKSAEELLKARIASDGAEVKRVVITANDWNIIRNKRTGAVIRRELVGYFADHMPSREDPCRVFTFGLQQQHDGTDFYGDYRLTGIGQDARILRIDCANVDK
jgi:hypothetical protein